MNKIIPVAGPSITQKEISYVNDAVTNGWYENAFNYITKFEDTFKNYLVPFKGKESTSNLYEINFTNTPSKNSNRGSLF